MVKTTQFFEGRFAVLNSNGLADLLERELCIADRLVLSECFAIGLKLGKCEEGSVTKLARHIKIYNSTNVGPGTKPDDSNRF